MTGQDDFFDRVRTSEVFQMLERLREQALQPHAKQIGEIIGAGRIPVVVFEPPGDVVALLRALGWDGSVVNRMTPEFIKRLARHDGVMAGWIQRTSGPGRILVLIHEERLLVNVDNEGLTLEPGSTHAELFQITARGGQA
jgi:hypothetical protein